MGENKYFKVVGHIKMIKSEEFVKKMDLSEIVDPNSRERSLGRWKDWVKEYMCERGATRRGGCDQGRKECLDRERWRLFCCGHPLGGYSRREQGVRVRGRQYFVMCQPSCLDEGKFYGGKNKS